MLLEKGADPDLRRTRPDPDAFDFYASSPLLLSMEYLQIDLFKVSHNFYKYCLQTKLINSLIGHLFPWLSYFSVVLTLFFMQLDCLDEHDF